MAKSPSKSSEKKQLKRAKAKGKAKEVDAEGRNGVKTNEQVPENLGIGKMEVDISEVGDHSQKKGGLGGHGEDGASTSANSIKGVGEIQEGGEETVKLTRKERKTHKRKKRKEEDGEGKTKTTKGDVVKETEEDEADKKFSKRERKKAKKRLENAETVPDSVENGGSEERTDKVAKVGEGWSYTEPGDDDYDLEWMPLASGDTRKTAEIPVVVGGDGRYIFHPTAAVINIHSLPSLTPLSVLSPSSRIPFHPNKSSFADPLSGYVTSLIISPKNPYQLISAYSTGHVLIWDWIEGKIQRGVNVLPAFGKLKQSKWNRKDLDIKLPYIPSSESGFANSPHNLIPCGITRPTKNVAGQSSTYTSALCLTSLSMSPTPAKQSSIKPILTLEGQKLLSVHADVDPDTQVMKMLVLTPENVQVLTMGLDPKTRNPTRSSLIAVIVKPTPAPLVSLSFSTTPNISNMDSKVSGGPSFPLEFALSNEMGQHHRYSINLNPLPHPNATAAILRPPKETQHWHSHASQLSPFYAPLQGKGLLSIGEEGVLVKWAMAGNKEFLPRLGGKGKWVIREVHDLSGSRNGAAEDVARLGKREEIVVGLEDGSVFWILEGKVIRRLGGVGMGASLLPTPPELDLRFSLPPFLFHPYTQSLILPSASPSSLQFFSPSLNSNICELTVAPSNRVSRKDIEEISESVVEAAVISEMREDSGQQYWLATMERWQDRDGRFGEEAALKFWIAHGGTLSFQLNTKVDLPHVGRLHSISFSPVLQPDSLSIHEPSPLLLTTGTDGYIKTWSLAPRLKGAPSWRCRSAFSYRGLPAFESCFSPDGSLFAVAHDNSVTLWETATNSLIQSFSTVRIHAKIVRFAGDLGTILVASGDNGILFWDLMTYEQLFETPLHASNVIVPPRSDLCICVPFTTPSSSSSSLSASTTLEIITISTRSFIPSFSTRFVKIPLSIRQAINYPSSSDSFSLAVIDHSGDLLLMGKDVKSQIRGTGTSDLTSVKGSRPSNNSLFEDLFGDTLTQSFASSNATIEPEPSNQIPTRSKSVANLFELPSHLLPPVEMLWKPFMDLQLREPEEERPLISGLGRSNAMDVDDDDDEEEEQALLQSGTGSNQEETAGELGDVQKPIESNVMSSIFRNMHLGS